MKTTIPLFVFVGLSLLFSIPSHASPVEQWGRFEAQIKREADFEDPFRDGSLEVEYTRPDGSRVSFWGFFDGASTWRLRFMPDQVGEWGFHSTFSDGVEGPRGTFQCVASDIPGPVGAYQLNPIWFGTRDGQPFLMRSFHCGDRFFAMNWDDPEDPSDGERRTVFLDWAQAQGYNTLSVASHYLNRETEGRGVGWETPDLWPLNPEAFQDLELMLDDLAERHMMVFPFAGFFGRASDFPREPEEQRHYLRYVMARLGPYWNLLYNVGGPEPRLRNKPYFSYPDVVRLGEWIQSMDPFGHALTVHNATGDDIYRGEPWLDFGTLQGPKTQNRELLAEVLLRNHHPARPLYAQETLWPGNRIGHPPYSLEDIRMNGLVILFSAAMINFGDMDGNSSSGFSNSMEPGEAVEDRHQTIQKTWNLFSDLSWASMKPRPDLVNTGYCLADPGEGYLVYLEESATLHVRVRQGPFQVEWIRADGSDERHLAGQTIDGRDLIPPGEGDWILYLYKQPIREVDGLVAFEAESGEGEWHVINSPTGKAILDPGQGRMLYEIEFTQPGDYYVFLLAKQGPRGRDKENDVLLFLDGEKLYGVDPSFRPDGMRSYGDWKWAYLPKGPGWHTPDPIRNDSVYFKIEAPGIYQFEIAHRSSNFAIDKVVMKLDAPNHHQTLNGAE